MTIAAAYLISEGVVLGADSATVVSVSTSEGRSDVVQLLGHAQKVFEVGENSRLGICTWGAGSIGNLSHRTLIARLADQVSQETTVETAAKTLCNIVVPLAVEARTGRVGYFLGGWDPGTHQPACFKIEIEQAEKSITPLPLGTCIFAGVPQFFTRVFRGYDPSLPDNLREEIKRRLPEGNLRTEFDSIFQEAFEAASRYLVVEGHKDLPMREALDFVYSYLHITVKALKFAFGPPLAGGPIEIGFISTDRHFRWVSHKPFSSAILHEEAKYDTRREA